MEQIITEILKHIAILNDEVGGIETSINILQIDVAVLQNQMATVLKLQYAVLAAFFSMMVGIIILIVKKVVNNKK